MPPVTVHGVALLILIFREPRDDGSQSEQTFVNMRTFCATFFIIGRTLRASQINQTQGRHSHTTRGNPGALILRAAGWHSLSTLDHDLNHRVTSRTARIELCAARSSCMVTPGDNTEELCRALDNLFLERRCIYSSFAVLSQFDFLLLGSCGGVGSGSGKEVVNLLVVDF